MGGSLLDWTECEVEKLGAFFFFFPSSWWAWVCLFSDGVWGLKKLIDGRIMVDGTTGQDSDVSRYV